MHHTDIGLPPALNRETVSEFMSRWLLDHVAHTTRPRTRQFYEMINRLYIAPVVGDIPLQQLAPGDVQAMIGAVVAKGLSATTARRTYATLHHALECALKWGVVYRNVCDAIDAPREADQQTNPPDKATVRALLERAVRGPYGAAFWLLAYSGMRRGEVAAIKREHLDLDNSTVSVVGAVGRQEGKLTVPPPKSKRVCEKF